MADTQRISVVLAHLILQEDIPLKALAIAGEAISADARVCAYPESTAHPATEEDLYQFLESYDLVLRRIEAIISNFSMTRDGESLINELSEAKEELLALKP